MAYHAKDREPAEASVAALVARLPHKDAARRAQAAQELFHFVAALSRQLSAERYAKALTLLAPQLFQLLQQSHEPEQLGALAAIDLLIELAHEDQLIRFANYLRNFLAQPHTSRAALLAASAALGHLARGGGSATASGTLVAAFVDFEVKRAFEWLQNGSVADASSSSTSSSTGTSTLSHAQSAVFSQRRLAACFVLRELAQSAPTLFHVNLTVFFQKIWGAIRDPKVEIREAATDALRACLELIAKRQTRHRVQWYCKVYDQVFEGLHLPSAGGRSAPPAGTTGTTPLPPASWESVHGSLLVVGELLQHTGGFMVPRFREICDTVLLYKDTKDKLVARTVSALLPRLAAFCPDAFLRHYLEVSLAHLLKRAAASAAERGGAFVALGQLARAVGDPHILPHVPAIVKLVRESLLHKHSHKLYSVETLTCIALLGDALHDKLEKYLLHEEDQLLALMMQGGLSEPLLDALVQIAASVPSVLPSVQDRLLHEISTTLRGVPFNVHVADGEEEKSSYTGGAAPPSTGGGGSGPSSVASPSAPPSRPSGVMQTLLSSFKLTASMASSSSPSMPPSSSPALADDKLTLSASSPSSAAIHLRGDTAEEREVVLLALRTLGQFDFGGQLGLLPFVRDCVALYLKHADPRIREQAVITTSQLLLPSPVSPSGLYPRLGTIAPRGPSGRVVDTLLSQLLLVGAADLDPRVRHSVVSSLDLRYDAWLGQAKHLTALLLLLNDESPLIREQTMALLARLAPRNPAVVLPSLRTLLRQLLTELEHAPPGDARLKEDATRLIGKLIPAAQHLIDPYLVRMLRVLLPPLLLSGGAATSVLPSPVPSVTLGPTANASLACAALVTLGELARVAQHSLTRYEAYLLPLLLHALQDGGSLEKRTLALQTLGRVAGATACVVRPYLAFPSLLETLLGLLQHSASSPWPLRREAMRTIGILGALDPYKHKLGLSRASMLAANDATTERGGGGGGGATLVVEGMVAEEVALGRELETMARMVPGGVDFGRPLGVDGLDEKQQIELQLFTAAPIGTKRMAKGSSAEGGAAAVGGDGNDGGEPGAVVADEAMNGGGGGGALSPTSSSTSSSSALVDPSSTKLTTGSGDFEKLLPPAADPLDPSALSPSADNYFPTVAISALLKILHAPALAAHHHGALRAIMFIFKSLQVACVPFLPHIVPPFLRVLARGEPRLRESLLLQLTTLVGIVQSHMKPFFPAMLVLVDKFWGLHLSPIVRLLQEMSHAAPLEFRQVYLPHVLPRIVDVLQPHAHPDVFFEVLAGGAGRGASGGGAATGGAAATGSMGGGDGLTPMDADASSGGGGAGGIVPSSGSSFMDKRQNMAALQIEVVQALIVFGDAVEDYVFLLLPALLRLLESGDTSPRVKSVALFAIARICLVASFPHYAGGRVLQPLARVTRQIVPRHAALQAVASGGDGSSSAANGGVAAPPSSSSSASTASSSSSATAVAMTREEGRQLADLVLYALAALLLQLQHEFLQFEPLVLSLLSATGDGGASPDLLLLLRRALDQLHVGERVSSSSLVEDAAFQSNASLQAMARAVPSPSSSSSSSSSSAAPSNTARLHVNQQNLRRAWEASQRSTREDWIEWMRRFSIELLRESPSAALRSCCALAQAYNPLARELFNPAFVSCWNELYEQYQDYLVRALETAFQSESIPPELLQTLLNLAEFMEHDVEALPIDIRELGELAQKCHAYAKALHYKELEFHTSPATCIEALISINNQLGQPEAAAGVLKFAQRRGGGARPVQVQETWYEKLQDWGAARALYDARIARMEEAGGGAAEEVDVYVGKMRCLEAMGEWEELAALAATVSSRIQDKRTQQRSGTGRRSASGGNLALGVAAPPLSSSSARLPRSNSGSLSRQGSLSSLTGGVLPSSSAAEDATISAANDAALQQIAMLGAKASWCLSDWDAMATYVDLASPSTPSSSSAFSAPSSASSASPGLEDAATDASLFKAVLAVHRSQFDAAAAAIDATRRLLDAKLGALVGESYSRAYAAIVTLQQLSELEEIVEYKRLRQDVATTEDASHRKQHLARMWQARLTGGCRRVVDVWQPLLAVRALVLSPHEDLDTWLQFASLCRQSGHLQRSLKVFTTTLGGGGGATGGAATFGVGEREQHRVAFAYMKHLWAVGDKPQALHQLQTLVHTVSASSAALRQRMNPTTASAPPPLPPASPLLPSALSSASTDEEELLVKCHLKLAEWQLALHDQRLDRVPSAPQLLASLQLCTELSPRSYKAWHAYALLHFRLVEASPSSTHASSIASALHGFFKSIALGRSRFAANVQQDILRVLTLWFAHGHRADVAHALSLGLASVSIDTWLIVLPQLIARIHSPLPRVQHQLHRLLSAIGQQHPHALIYPLSVALKSPLEVRQQAADAIMTALRRHAPRLVDEALLVSKELIRVAILWHEMWHEGLEEASRLYFGDHDIDGMVGVLEPLHQMMASGPETLREVSFQQAFGRDLREAYEWLQRFLLLRARSGGAAPPPPPNGGAAPPPPVDQSDLNRAWDLYYHVFRRINKQLPQLTSLELQYVSPNLLQATRLSLAVPGTYRAGHAVIPIHAFLPTVLVITSKQRPRRITMVGGNGLEYMFLLKGHEDLRQDERVTQLFGLVNALLINDRLTAKKQLEIHRYPVVPLSHNAGIVGWVPHCDTLHQLIRDYRDARKILLNIEHRLMLQMAPDYDALPLLPKVEVFEYALENTAGQDLYKVLWLKSDNSEVWLDRRSTYTRSLAVMSMVGYILGLGDRHPSNLMLHRFSGTIVHIDFGDCFEVAMEREKYPEKIPFRLTRMLTNAMEVSGLEGTFRFSCEAVMRVLRENRHSLMAMLEAFVHDPLICWRLLAPKKEPSKAAAAAAVTTATAVAPGAAADGGDVPRGQQQQEEPRQQLEQQGDGRTEVVAKEDEAKSDGGEEEEEEEEEEEGDHDDDDEDGDDDDDEEDDEVAPSLSSSAIMLRTVPRPARAAPAATATSTTITGGIASSMSSRASVSRAVAMPGTSVRGQQLPPRPLPTSVAGSRPMSMSKSIAFTRRPPPARAAASSASATAAEEEGAEPVERVDHTATNLHAEMATLAASVATEGQGSMRRDFSQTAAEAKAAAAKLQQQLVQQQPQPTQEAPASDAPQNQNQTQTQTQTQAKSEVHANRSHRERELVQALGPEGAGAPREALNEKAVAVIRRVQAKLTGRDFDDADREPLDVSAQVQRLIDQATSHENLCQCYIGWCPFW